MTVRPLDLSKLRVFPLAERKSLTRTDDILLDPEAAPAQCPERVAPLVQALRRQDSVGPAAWGHGPVDLRRPSAPQRGRADPGADDGPGLADAPGHQRRRHDSRLGIRLVRRLHGKRRDERGPRRLRRLARNGREHPPRPDGRRLDKLGYGRALGRLILEDGATLPATAQLAEAIAADPTHPLTAARADLLRTMREQGWPAGRVVVEHRWKHASILAQAYRHGVPLTVHPGIGYDIISNHPVFNGAALGRAAEWDFALFGGSVEGLDGGVVLSVGSAIMGPQVFEKSLSCVNNLRLQAERAVVRDHGIYVVDLQDGGGWDWTRGEPPKTNPAYYLRFCKSFSRMGGAMHYLQCDNAAFVHNLYRELQREE